MKLTLYINGVFTLEKDVDYYEAEEQTLFLKRVYGLFESSTKRTWEIFLTVRYPERRKIKKDLVIKNI